MITRIKVDTEAIKRNGALPKDGTAKYEPAIMVIEYYDSGKIASQRLVHSVEYDGHTLIQQDDLDPGAISTDGRAARVWVTVYGEVGEIVKE